MIVDDHPVVLDGLVLILSELFPQSDIITASDGVSACTLVDSHLDLDWIFLDVNLPDTDGFDLLAHFDSKKLTAHTIILSSDSKPSMTDRALKQNASGFLSKAFTRHELRQCIETIESGQKYLAPDLLRELTHYRQYAMAEQQRIVSVLTKRQHQTLELLATGYSNKEIAVSCNIAES